MAMTEVKWGTVNVRITHIQIEGIRCFQDTGPVPLSPTVNVIIGSNNAGKSTFLRAIYSYHGMAYRFQSDDFRVSSPRSYTRLVATDFGAGPRFNGQSPSDNDVQVLIPYQGSPPGLFNHIPRVEVHPGNMALSDRRPDHLMVPSIARRTASAMSEDMRMVAFSHVSGTMSNLYSKIDNLAVSGHPRHEMFSSAVEDIIGIKITTQSSEAGKRAGYYLSPEKFVHLDQMGDGLIEMLSIITDLCLEKGRVLILEEPETHLHPRAIKGLMKLVRASIPDNQFLIATHSNVVLRELATCDGVSVIRISKDKDDPTLSHVSHIEDTPSAHMEVLRELGYDLGDFGLFDLWLFLEEASAETVINRVLVPNFVPHLSGRVRTFSCAGVTNVEPKVDDFQRLITFVHLQPVYQGRLWVRVDGDEPGVAVVESLRARFPHLDEVRCSTFERACFEYYYPEPFQEEAANVLAIVDRQARREAKRALLVKVLEWTDNNMAEAIPAWQQSASEIIQFLGKLDEQLKIEGKKQGGANEDHGPIA